MTKSRSASSLCQYLGLTPNCGFMCLHSCLEDTRYFIIPLVFTRVKRPVSKWFSIQRLIKNLRILKALGHKLNFLIYFQSFYKILMAYGLCSIVLKSKQTQLKINLNISDVEQEANAATGHVKNYLRMLLFTVEVPGHSVLIVTFLNTSTDLMFGLKVDKPPRSYELLSAKNIISADNVNGNQNVFIDNPWDDVRSIYLAVRAVNDIKEKSNFSFITRVQLCLTWDFEQTDPQWSTGPCKTIPASQEEIVCHCYHLSIFAGKSYPTVANEDLDDNMLLERLGFNWFILEKLTNLEN
uniref:GPS domain-containing protein n=1 Tax=Glossina austeni TaxID=7395 RepID=A0A1A9VG64_GLOAU